MSDVYAHPNLSVAQVREVCEENQLAPRPTAAGNMKLAAAKEYLRSRGIREPRARIGTLAPFDPFFPRELK